MKNLFLIVVMVFGFSSCSDNIDNEVPDCGEASSVTFSNFTLCGSLKENPKQPSYVVITSQEGFMKAFNVCPSFIALDLPDFTQKRILGIMAGPKPTEGYSIKIQSIRQDNCQIVVEYFEKEPKPEDEVATVITYPADYVVIPKSDKPFYFVKVKEIGTTTTVNDSFDVLSGADRNNFLEIKN